MDIKLSDLKSLPNILSILRIAMIPLFSKYYLEANTGFAGAIVFISGLTDLLDGYIARKYNQITALGKVLDPIADKLTQLAIILLMMNRYPFVPYLLLIFLVKEFTMLIVTAYLHKQGERYDGAAIYGKISTFIFYACMIFLFLSPQVSEDLAKALILITTIGLVFSWSMYSLSYWRSYQKIKDKIRS